MSYISYLCEYGMTGGLEVTFIDTDAETSRLTHYTSYGTPLYIF